VLLKFINQSRGALLSVTVLTSMAFTPGQLLAAGGKLSLTGSSTVAPLALEIAKRFEQKNPGVRIDVQTGGSGRGINDARAGLADIGLVSRALKADESDLKSYSIAQDGIAVIVHKSNPVKGLTAAQIIDIYTGKVQNWNQVGGKDQKITVVNKAEGRSTLELFTQFFKLKNSDIKAQAVIGDNQQGIKTVSGNPGAIAYVSIGTAEFEEENGSPIKLISMDGMTPSTDAVASGKFPLSRPLNLVTKGPATGLAKQFIEFAQSTQVKDLVKEQYFVPLVSSDLPTLPVTYIAHVTPSQR
jgi:phosphate transport system substrate-binding protein